MYAHIRGTVCSIMPDRVVIEAAGVGFELFCSSLTINRLREGDTAKLLTHFHLSQDAVALYGFNTESEREMFRKLIGITRIGPKVALNVLSVLTPEDVALAVVTENAAAFSRVQGLGKKTAARLILELKEKVDAADGIPSVSVSEASAPIRSEAIAALVSLGYDGALAGRVVSELPECDTVEEMIKQALRELSRK